MVKVSYLNDFNKSIYYLNCSHTTYLNINEFVSQWPKLVAEAVLTKLLHKYTIQHIVYLANFRK